MSDCEDGYDASQVGEDDASMTLEEATALVLKAREETPFYLFRPYDGKQRSVLCNEKRRCAVLGGNRSGKTTIGAYWLLCHMTGMYPDYWPEHMRFKAPIRARIIIEEYKEHGPVLIGKIRAIANKDYVTKWYKNPQGYVTGFECANGSVASILTHEQSTDSHEGWDGHVVWADEPIPKDKFIANIRGLVDHNGQFLNTMTPLKEPWISDEIYEENPTLWNVINLDVAQNPHISSEALAEFYASIDADQLEARKYGRFIHLSGAIYHAFSKQKHVVPSRKLPTDWPRFNVCDPHDRRPFALGWYAVDPLNRIWVYDEYPNSMFHKIRSTDLKTEDFATVIRNKEGRNIASKRIIDRRYGFRRQAQSGSTLQEDLSSYDLFFTPSYDDAQGGIEAGHICVKEYLGRKDQEPRLFIMEHCVNHIYAMTHYIYDEKTGKPREDAKDFADLTRYMCMEKPDYDAWQSDPSKRIEETCEDKQGHGTPEGTHGFTHTFSEYE